MSVSLIAQHPKRMRRNKCMSPVRLLNFNNISKRHDFQKNVSEHNMYILIFSMTSFRNISRSKIIKRNFIITVHRSSSKVPVILVRV